MRRIRNYDFSKKTAEEVNYLMIKTKDLSKYKRMLVIYLKSMYGCEAKQISEITGFTIKTVWRYHALWRCEGYAIFDQKKIQGGRRSSYISLEAEKDFLKQFDENTEFKKIHEAYRMMLGEDIALSTTYRLLKRHKEQGLS